MIERRSRVCFLLKTTQPALVCRQARCKHLEGNLAPELEVFGEVHLAHASLSENRNDRVVGQLSAGLKRLRTLFRL